MNICCVSLIALCKYTRHVPRDVMHFKDIYSAGEFQNIMELSLLYYSETSTHAIVLLLGGVFGAPKCLNVTS